MKKQKNTRLSYPVNVAVLPGKGMRIALKPDEHERALLAAKAGVLSVEHFSANLEFKRWRRDGVSVTGQISADFIQECAVTLEPISSSITEEIDRTFLPEGSKLARPELSNEGELILDYEGRDEPDLFTGEYLDAYEIVLEHFILAIDPFARKEGAEFTDLPVTEVDAAESNEESPFAALKDLIKP